MKFPLTKIVLLTAAMATAGCVRDLLPVPEGVSQIHLTGNHWSPNNPAMQAMQASFGKESPYTITVQRIVDAQSGVEVFNRAQSPRSLVDSVYADVAPGNYFVEYSCVLTGYKGEKVADLATKPVALTTSSRKRYNVGIYAVTAERTVSFGGAARLPAGSCALSFVERNL